MRWSVKNMPPPPKKKKKQTHTLKVLFVLLPLSCRPLSLLQISKTKSEFNSSVGCYHDTICPRQPGYHFLVLLLSNTKENIFFLWSWKVSINLINLFAIYTQCSIYICTLRYPRTVRAIHSRKGGWGKECEERSFGVRQLSCMSSM